MDSESRRLTEQELQLVLRRAAELQEAKGSDRGDLGPTGDDVIKMGEELGMDASCLRLAVEEVLAGKRIQKRGLWSGLLTFESDRTYAGELSEDGWHSTVQVLRSSFGRPGAVSEVAGAKEWDGTQGVLDPIHLSARSKLGSTRVTMTSDLYGAAFIIGLIGLLPTLLVMTAVSRGVELSVWVELLISGGILAAAAAGWSAVLRWMGARRRRAIADTERAIDALANSGTDINTSVTETEAEVRLQT